MSNTIQLLFPQWQGGDNLDYLFGAELLSHIVPQNPAIKKIRVPVDQNITDELDIQKGIKAEATILKQLTSAKKILSEQAPDKVIVLGGDCAVSQAPFDYLNGKYQNVGILWLDAHPDVATLEGAVNSHEMVLGNLIGHGAPQLADKVDYPFAKEKVFLAGSIEKDLRPKDQAVNLLDLQFATPKELKKNFDTINAWLDEQIIDYLVVHFDLDVLSSEDFRSIYPAEPYLKSFDAAVVEMTLEEITNLLLEVSKKAEIVGLTIAEHLPWDAFRLRNSLAKLSLFKES